MMPIVLVATATVFAVGGCAWVRARSGPVRELHWFRCPRCGQKLRYQPNRAGRIVACPGCKHGFALPAEPQTTPSAGSSAEGYRLRRKDEPTRTVAAAGRERSQR
jgi:ribosomal protein L37AE/L43A